MTSMDALSFLMDLFFEVSGVDALFNKALDASRVVDVDGFAPTDVGWTETVDEWLAAAWIADRLALANLMTPTAGVLKQVNSEGTTLTVDPGQPVNWAQVATTLRSRSSLLSASSGFGLIDLDGPAPTGLPRSWGLL